MFNIDKESWTICFSEQPVTGDPDVLNFSSEKALMNLADAQQPPWTRQDLEGIWNEFAGKPPFEDCNPTGKIKNRPAAVQRIWNAIQRLAPTEAQKPTLEASVKEPRVKKTKAPKAAKAPKAKKEPKAKKAKKVKAVKEPKPISEVKKRGRSANGNSKLDQAAALMFRKGGATAAELREKLGWSDGSIGFFVRWVSFTLRSGIKSLASEKDSDGTVTYKAA